MKQSEARDAHDEREARYSIKKQRPKMLIIKGLEMLKIKGSVELGMQGSEMPSKRRPKVLGDNETLEIPSIKKALEVLGMQLEPERIKELESEKSPSKKRKEQESRRALDLLLDHKASLNAMLELCPRFTEKIFR